METPLAPHLWSLSAYKIESRTLLSLTYEENKFKADNFALNEFTLHKKDSSMMMTVHVFVDGGLCICICQGAYEDAGNTSRNDNSDVGPAALNWLRLYPAHWTLLRFGHVFLCR